MTMRNARALALAAMAALLSSSRASAGGSSEKIADVRSNFVPAINASFGNLGMGGVFNPQLLTTPLTNNEVFDFRLDSSRTLDLPATIPIKDPSIATEIPASDQQEIPAGARKPTIQSLAKTTKALAAAERDGSETLKTLDRTFDAEQPAAPSSVYAASKEHPTQTTPDDLMARLRRRGVRSTITVYGSARILPPERARANYKETVRRVGPHPSSPTDKQALQDARMNLKMSRYYKMARRLGELIVQKTGKKTAIVDGGGPGIMQAAPEGSAKNGGSNVGLNIILPSEQALNLFIPPELSLRYDDFSERQKNLRANSSALFFFPGGFGTLYELTEVLTLMQTGKMPRVPIVLIGRKHWNKILNVEELAARGLIAAKDKDLIQYADEADEAYALVRDALSAANR